MTPNIIFLELIDNVCEKERGIGFNEYLLQGKVNFFIVGKVK